MINRPFEGNLHNDLGIAEATDETLDNYLHNSRNPIDTISLLEALNNSTSKTDSPEGRRQLLAALQEYRRLVETYSTHINEFIAAAEKELEYYPQIVKSKGEKIIRDQFEELVRTLASKITDRFGNLHTSRGVSDITNKLLSISLRAYTAETFAGLEDSVTEINERSKIAFDNASQAEQTTQFKAVIAVIAEKTEERSKETLELQITEA